jgi:ADP-heptose:LPS heptosyltransferase
MGDVLSLSVMFEPLLSKFPECKIVVWCHDRNRKVYEDDRRVSRVVSGRFFWSDRGTKRASTRDWISIYRSVMEVRSLRPTVGVDARGEIRSQILLCLAGCRRRIGSRVYLSSNMTLRGFLLTDAPDTSGSGHRFEKNLQLLSPLLGDTPDLHLPAISRSGDPSKEEVRKVVVMHVGAGWEFRRWDSKCWRELIDKLTESAGIRIILVEGPGEEEINEAIVRDLVRPVERIATSLKELLSVVSSAALFVGLDSGPMHIATLMGIPTIGLFGPGDVELWRPLGPGGKAIHHTESYNCHPCLQKECVRPEDPCISRIGVPEVYESIQRSLGLESENSKARMT